MQGTRRTVVTAAASFAVVLGVGSVAPATGRNGSHPRSTTGHLASPYRKPAAATVRAHAEEASSTTETDEDISTTVDESTTTTVEEPTSTTVRNHTPDIVDNEIGENETDDHGDATEEANETENENQNENSHLQEQDHHDGDSHQAGDQSQDDHGANDGSD